MAGVTWILLRSLRTHVRVCWDIRHTPLYFWLAQAFGWGLPALFLAISLPITGVSYRLGGNCLPNPHGAFVTWFGWLLAFACLAAVIQFITTGFCLFIYARNLLGYSTPGSSGIAASTGSSTPAVASTDSKAGDIGKRLAWRRVSKVMLMQWRSIVLSLLVILESVYFGTVYAAQVNSAKEAAKPEHTAQTEAWSLCLILNGGDKNQCLSLAQQLRLEESVVIASLFMASLIGLFTFALMVRWSMLVGWFELLSRRRSHGPHSVNGNGNQGPVKHRGRPVKRISLGRKLPSQKAGILPSPEMDIDIPEAGDVTRRHETTTLFDDSDGDMDDEKRRGRRPDGADAV
ncbi:hypothetical protein LTR37_008847 [Vermiconidia calcicola]|uniref:Uncharacterized protein n=1 Tax=Vermiconidia calcicola TaxID=1690605 RepID=A0ACC3N9N2_9PEZI|nr:hypothetical protein LTR37_008847 [Vermiconidia calcicola]